jgi:hypothetical protein
MHEMIGLRPYTERFLLWRAVELSEEYFSDLESLRGRICANDIKGIQLFI